MFVQVRALAAQYMAHGPACHCAYGSASGRKNTGEVYAHSAWPELLFEPDLSFT
jgi:hypothetical protein